MEKSNHATVEDTVGVPRAFPMRRSGCPFDVPGEYEALRAVEPVSRAVLRDGSTVWLVARHADVQAGLVDGRISCDGSTPGIPMPGGSGVDPVGRRSSFVRMDPPEHDVYRKLLAQDFTMRKARALRPWIQEVVDRALDDLADSGQPADLVQLLAMPVPSTVVCHVLGVPNSDHEFFQSRAAVMLNRGSSREDLRNAVVELRTYMVGLLKDKRDNPGDDVLTKLANAPAELGLDDNDLAGAAQSVLNASHEATVNMIALGTLVLTENPHALAELKADPGLWPGAVDELLRYLGIGDLLSPRIAKQDLEIAGQRIAAGEGLYFLTGSANRDKEVYDDPAAFDIHRPNRGHLAFGYGLHQCLGQNLARVELEVVFESLFRRFPDLRSAVPVDELSYKHDSALFGVHELPVVW
ncbi:MULTISPECIES: cytochrome P450 [unclassified Saccharothrix]|uniref:cytochrome P450 n=1 Tax=unclassified Saccharothrix TaxID=2593673 RepID=UPI00307D7903